MSRGRVSPAGPLVPPPTSCDGECAESKVASAPSALAAEAGPGGGAKPAGNGRLRAAGNAPADGEVQALSCLDVCPCAEAPAHPDARTRMRAHTRARTRGEGTIEPSRLDGCCRSGIRLIERVAP